MVGTNKYGGCTENEEFTLKNAYHLEMVMVASVKGECSYVIEEGSVQKGYGK